MNNNKKSGNKPKPKMVKLAIEIGIDSLTVNGEKILKKENKDDSKEMNMND